MRARSLRFVRMGIATVSVVIFIAMSCSSQERDPNSPSPILTFVRAFMR